MNRLGGRGASGRIRVRFKRAWRGYKPGDEIAPPAALREQLLHTKTPLGDPIAEVVDVPADVAAVQASVPAGAASELPPAETGGLLDGLMPKSKKTKAKKE